MKMAAMLLILAMMVVILQETGPVRSSCEELQGQQGEGVLHNCVRPECTRGRLVRKDWANIKTNAT